MENKKVVIVFNDQDPVLARVSRVKFKKEAGWDIAITSSYQEALDYIKSNPFDLLITELMLKDNKGRDGFDFIKEVKSLVNEDSAIIAVLTELGQDEDRQKAMDYGADYYFVKSEISIQDLITELQLIESKTDPFSS